MPDDLVALDEYVAVKNKTRLGKYIEGIETELPEARSVFVGICKNFDGLLVCFRNQERVTKFSLSEEAATILIKTIKDIRAGKKPNRKYLRTTLETVKPVTSQWVAAEVEGKIIARLKP